MEKEKTSISRHKTSSTRSAGQSFDDVIPPGKVQPSASSRPVITPTAPVVTDNTLKPASSAPELNLKHSTPNLDAPKPSAKSEAKGVLLADLVAKREKATSTETALEEEKNKPKDTPAEKPVDPDNDPDKPTAESDGTVPADEAVESKEEVPAPKPDEAAPAEEPKPEEPEDKPADDDSLDAVLRSGEVTEDGAGEPSDTVKEAMKDLDEKDGRPHHALYEGKPVIVIHKHHGSSAGRWILWFFLCLLLALVIVDLLLDAGIITTDYIIPHTNFL